MKTLKYLLLASLVAVAACDEEVTVDTQTGSVRVTVTAGGSPLQGITVSLGAAGTQPVVTGTDGVANFATVPVGTYTVTVTGLTADVVCSSTTQPVTVAAGQTTAVTFACNIVQTSSISGTVAFSNGDPRPNASITITRTAPAGGTAVNLTTDATGRYSLTGLRSGTYTVALPVTTGCTTAANTQTVQLAAGEARVVNFTCTVAAPTEPATVAIQSITAAPTLPTDHPTLAANCPAAGTSLEPSQLSCRVNITVGIEEGQQTVSRLELVLGNQVVYTQNFGAAAVSEEMQLATFNVTATINTAAYNATTGVPAFLNGAINLIARIYTTGSPTTPVHAATLAAQLLNPDLVAVTVTLPRTALGVQSPTTGLTWEGGSLTANGIPVMYSGKTVTRLVFQINCPVLADNSTITDTTAPFSAVFADDDDCDDQGVDDVEDPGVTVSAATVLSDGQPGPSFTTGMRRVDNVAPVISLLQQALRFSPAYDPTGWVGKNHTFTVANAATASGSDTTRPRATDGGVGMTGSFFTFMAGAETGSMSAVTAPTALAESLTRSAYYLNLTVMDILTNSVTRWHDGNSAGVSGSSSNLAGLATNPNARFGVDLTDPTIEIQAGTLVEGGVIQNLGGVVNPLAAVSYTDPQGAANSTPSGFPANPVLTRIRREAPNVTGSAGCAVGNYSSSSGCRTLGTVRGQPGTIGAFDFTTGTYSNGSLTDAYYRIEYRATDAAGNLSQQLDYRVVSDVVAPTVACCSFPAAPVAGSQVSFSSNAADNLDLNQAHFFLVFGGAGESIRQSVTNLGEWGPAAFTTEATASATVTFINGLQEGNAAAPTAVTNGSFRLTDFARNSVYGMSGPLLAGTLRNFNTNGGVTAEGQASSQANVCWDTDADGCPTTTNSSTSLSFFVQGAGGNSAIANPFIRVTFYVALDENDDGVPDVDSGGNRLWTSLGNGSVSVTDNGTTRTYTFTMSATGAQLGMASGRATAGPVTVRAVGYSIDGAAFTVADGALVVVTLAVD